VNPAVSSAVYLGIFVTILVAATAVVTPLGLYDAVVPSTPRRIYFNYAQDMAAFGYGTLPRNGLDFNRICGRGRISCPGSNFSVIRTNDTDNFPYNYEWPDGYYTNISLETQSLWASGLDAMQGSVSSMFDIQWRSYEIRQQNLSSIVPSRYNFTQPQTAYDRGSPYIVGGYRQVHTLLSSNGFEIVEGLIVDLATGGIGFRNHTVPSQSSQKAVWTEDILFIVPETKCVDNNLTIDYDLKEDSVTNGLGPGGIFRLTDHGGFANLNSTVNLEGLLIDSSQDNVVLHDRALIAAWFNNAITMLYMNLTNRELMKTWEGYERATTGTSYLLEDESNSTEKSMMAMDLPKPGSIALGQLGQHLDWRGRNQNRIFKNPHNVTYATFSDLGMSKLPFHSKEAHLLTNYTRVVCPRARQWVLLSRNF
jgi:hypothetical protein